MGFLGATDAPRGAGARRNRRQSSQFVDERIEDVLKVSGGVPDGWSRNVARSSAPEEIYPLPDDSTPYVCVLKKLVERAPSGLVSLEERRIDDFRQRVEQPLSDEAVLGMVDDLRARVHGGLRDPLNFGQSHFDPIAAKPTTEGVRSLDRASHACATTLAFASSQSNLPSRNPPANIPVKAVFLPVESI
jgi:hypothetical protein